MIDNMSLLDCNKF